LSDEGKDALLTVQTVENASPKKDVGEKRHRHLKIGLKPVAFLLMALLIASSAVAVYEYSQAADNHTALLREKYTNADEIAGAYIDQYGTQHIILTNNATTEAINAYLYIHGNGTAIVFENAKFPLSRLYAVQDALDGVMIKFSIDETGVNEITNKIDVHLHDSTKQKDIIDFLNNKFNDFDERCISFLGPLEIVPSAVLTANTNSSYTPPISMYKALQIAIEADGRNKTLLNGMNIDARLTTIQTATNGTFSSVSPLTNIPIDYSDVYGNGIIYQYAWEITISNASRPTYMRSFTFIDASTGQILPNPPLSTDLPW
jgi:hypothetical protein